MSRVAPSELASDIIEIRPSRHLRIQHHNPRPRDEQFRKEMETFSQYKLSGTLASGPLVMPKRSNHQWGVVTTSLPADEENRQTSDINGKNHISQIGSIATNQLVKENTLPESITNDDYDLDPSISSRISDKIQSASSVLFALHNVSQGERQIDEKQKSLQKPISDECKSPSKENYLHNRHHSFDNKAFIQNKDLNGTSSVSDESTFSNLVLFFIHGVGGSSDIWSRQIQYFSEKGYEIIAPDLIGHGFSCCPKNGRDYHFREIAADMEAMFDKYCKKKNVVVGHSYGGSFATLLARTRSRRILKLVLISSGPPTPLAPQSGVFTLPICLLNCLKPCLICGFINGAFHKKQKSVLSKRSAFSIPTNVLQHMMNGQDWPDGDEVYHNWLTCQCLLIYGEDDQLVSLEDEIDAQKAIFNSHLEVVKNASHMVMMEAPNEVNELLEMFIKRDINAVAQGDHQDNQLESNSHALEIQR